MVSTLIAQNDHWVIWASLISVAAFSLFLEQRFRVVQKITGALVAMVGGMLLSNTGFLPIESPSYDVIWEYIIPLAIPLLLIKVDIRRIFRETGRMFGAFHISALGTIVGSLVAMLLLSSRMAGLKTVVPPMTGSYIGGSVNLLALRSMFETPKDLFNAVVVADNGCMGAYFLLLITLPSWALMRRLFPGTERSRAFREAPSEGYETYWTPKPISLLDIASAIAVAFIIAAISAKVSAYFSDKAFPAPVRVVLGQKYILLTTLSAIFPLVFSGFSRRLRGSEELGVFLIFIFFALVGVPASISAVIEKAPTMLLLCAIMLSCNFIVTILLGKLFKYELEELILAAVVTSGGPMNGVAIAKSKGWHVLVVPSLLVGVWGYIIGNYAGYFIGLLLDWLF